MNRQVKLLVPILILIGLFLYAYFNKYTIKNYFDSKDRIYWSEQVNIEFSDYRGTPDAHFNMAPFHAFNLATDNIQDAEVRAFFDKNESWAKDTLEYDFKKENELQQLRFDLYEAYARKFNAEIDVIKDNPRTNISDLEAIGDRLYTELRIIDVELYNETFSIDQRLARYGPTIDSLLNSYKN